MVTQLVDVLLLTPLYALGTLPLRVRDRRRLDPRMRAAARGGASVLALGRLLAPLRRDFRRGARDQRGAHGAHPGDVSGIRVLKAYGAEARPSSALRGRGSRAPSTPRFDARSHFAIYAVAALRRRWAASWLGGAAWGACESQPAGDALRRAPLRATGVATWSLGVFQFFRRIASATARTRSAACSAPGRRVQDVAVGLDRVLEVLDREPEVRDADDALDLAPGRDGLALPRRVASATTRLAPHSSTSTSRRRSGAITAVVGPTGAGKSTLLALALRLFDPDSGRGRDRRRRSATLRDREPARARRDRAAGEPALRHHDPREHPLRGAGRERRGRAGGRARRVRGRVHRALAAGLRHPARRARHEALDRPAPAALDRARGAEGCTDPAARRADRVARRRDRAPRAREPRALGPRARDPAGHASARRRCGAPTDRRARRRPHRRVRERTTSCWREPAALPAPASSATRARRRRPRAVRGVSREGSARGTRRARPPGAVRVLGRALRYVGPFRARFAVKLALLVASAAPAPAASLAGQDHDRPRDRADSPSTSRLRPTRSSCCPCWRPSRAGRPEHPVLDARAPARAPRPDRRLRDRRSREQDTADAYLSGGHDTQTRTENEANAGFSLAGGLFGWLDFRYTIRLTQDLNHSLPLAALRAHPRAADDGLRRRAHRRRRLPRDVSTRRRSRTACYRILLTPIGSLALGRRHDRPAAGDLRSEHPTLVAALAMIPSWRSWQPSRSPRPCGGAATSSRAAGAVTTSTLEEGLAQVLAVQSMGGEAHQRGHFDRDSWTSFGPYPRPLAHRHGCRAARLRPGLRPWSPGRSARRRTW